MKIFLDTIGCRLNQAEIESLARQFRKAGHEIVASRSRCGPGSGQHLHGHIRSRIRFTRGHPPGQAAGCGRGGRHRLLVHS